jgi:DNA repair exonuclease SbcCD ATPase subunit
MRNAVLLFILFALILTGCGDKAKLQQLEKQNNDLTRQLASRDSSIQDITTMMNEINNKLESVLAKEKNVERHAATTSGSRSLSLAEVKQSVLHEVSDIVSTLSDSRRRIAQLEQKMKGAASEKASLQKTVDDLKKNLEAREKSLSELQARATKLESDIMQNTQTIATYDTTIQNQTRQLNTVCYVIGKRNELKQKGIITDEGGFLWGLLGATTVLTTNYDDQAFQSLDKRSEMTINVPGKIDEMVPKRDGTSYSKEPQTNGHTLLKIVRPDYFWKANHLAIIID